MKADPCGRHSSGANVCSGGAEARGAVLVGGAGGGGSGKDGGRADRRFRGGPQHTIVEQHMPRTEREASIGEELYKRRAVVLVDPSRVSVWPVVHCQMSMFVWVLKKSFGCSL